MAQGMGRAIVKSLAVLAVLLVLLVLAVYLASRMAGPTKVEREALALIDAPPQRTGEDGFAALYTVDLEMPDDQRATLLAEDVRRFADRALSIGDGAGQGAGWQSLREGWPSLGEAQAGEPAWCSLRGPDCLDTVRADTDAYARLLERTAPMLDRAEALRRYGHFHNPFPPRLDMPLPALQSISHLLTRNAWRYASGDVDAALAGTCAAVDQGRNLVETGDGLINSMVGAAVVQGNAALLAGMLAELPRGQPIPAGCADALAPAMDVAGGLCRAMLSEGRFITGGLRSQISDDMAAQAANREMPKWLVRLLFDPERTAARIAPRLAWYCGEPARMSIAADRPLTYAEAASSRWSLACASNAIGCILADIADPAYTDYGRRLQDADARLRTTATLLWLREQPGPVDAAALSRLPAGLASPARPFQLDAASATLGTPLYEKPRQGEPADGVWRVPLPASRLQPAPAAPEPGGAGRRSGLRRT